MIEHRSLLQTHLRTGRDILRIAVDMLPFVPIENIKLNFKITNNGEIFFETEKEKATLSDGLTFSPELDLKSS